jgi:hypothetical protein
VSRQPDFSTGPRREPLAPRGERLLVAAAVLALAVSGTAAYRARAEARDATARAAEARRQLDEQQARLRAMDPTGANPAAGAAEAPPGRVIGAVAAVLPLDARLAQVTIDYQHGVVVDLQVDAKRAEAWDRLLERMERSPDFADVESGPEDRAAEVRTTLRARWKGGAR